MCFFAFFVSVFANVFHRNVRALTYSYYTCGDFSMQHFKTLSEECNLSQAKQQYIHLCEQLVTYNSRSFFVRVSWLYYNDLSLCLNVTSWNTRSSTGFRKVNPHCFVWWQKCSPKLIKPCRRLLVTNWLATGKGSWWGRKKRKRNRTGELSSEWI